ncbi:hypothetical protein AVME950_19730 [Acidovorax sp. SUPP950]|uniref:LysM peptidoglycan-binding domain-containing protein n=1 Tax=Acidovorax sp. SUPP950 TaxID=511901 RepID=UPI0023D0CFA6|nr:LysM peptidoglycan-binding domain-containing protein [Acidovorax sp. SUPP950]GKS77164.1 hypothetical protein AVME950_19730 [Acidovorax sp. SUPP950]
MSNIEQTTGVADERFNRAFVNDVQGNAVYVNQGAGHTGRVQNLPGGYLGGWVGDSVNPGHVQRQLVANGEVLARYGDAPDSENPPANAGEIPKYVDTAEFRLNAAPLKLKGANLDAIAYTVVGGETLKDIARNVLGDAKLWWRIAEANGLAVSGDGQLAAGQTLSVPKLALNANNVDTFQPYDPSRVTGSMDPNLPAPAGQGGGGCGGLGKIIMVAIAVVVAVYAPQFLGQLGIPELTVGGTTTALGGAVGGAAGSVASQVAGNVLGVQDGFSWKSVALSAIGGGMSSGLANTELLGGTTFGATVARAAVGNVMSQGIGVVTGLQDRFDWKSVAASAVGAGVGQMVGEALGGYSLREGLAGPVTAPAFSGLGDFAGSLARGTLTGLAAGTAAAVMRGGRVSIQQVATDAFGNALGQSVAAASQPQPQPESIYSLAGTGTQLSSWTAQAPGNSSYDDTYRQANLERMELMASGGMPDGRTVAQVQEQWIDAREAVAPLAAMPASSSGSLISNPDLLGRNAQGGYSWSSGFDTYPVTVRSIQSTELEPIQLGSGAAAVSGQDYSLFSRASMNEYWSGEGLVNRAMRTVGNLAYDVASALTPAASTPQELQRARELGQLRQAFSAARSAGDIAAMQSVQARHAQITSSDGNPSMVQVPMASDILRAQTAAGLPSDRGSLGLAAGAAITQGFGGMVSPKVGGGGNVEGAGSKLKPYSGNQAVPDFVGPIRPATEAPTGPVTNAAGAARAAKYNAFQQGVSLNDTISLIGGDKPTISYTTSGKTIYANPSTGLQVVYDNAGNYFRVENTNVIGPLRYTDQFGNPIPANVPLVKPSGTTQTGVPSDVRNGLTHFTNTRCKAINMHKSYFMYLQDSALGPARELVLLDETSEWLFHTGYWSLLSVEHSRQYEQYEEEVMPSSHIASAIEKLTAAAKEIQSSGSAPISFTVGWDANRKSLDCVTTVDALASDLKRLQEFLKGAHAGSLDVYCQL